MNNVTLGKKIKKARLNLNMSQKEVADKIDVSRAHYISVEKGEVFPKYDKMLALKKILHLKEIAL